jgi:hypothetical protein
MSNQIVRSSARQASLVRPEALPFVITSAGESASRRFIEFFTANIRNKNTRMAYMRALGPFLEWCDERGLALGGIQPVQVAAYVEQHSGSKPTVKQHLAAIRMLFDWLVIGQVVPVNPAASVRGQSMLSGAGRRRCSRPSRRACSLTPLIRVVSRDCVTGHS